MPTDRRDDLRSARFASAPPLPPYPEPTDMVTCAACGRLVDGRRADHLVPDYRDQWGVQHYRVCELRREASA